MLGITNELIHIYHKVDKLYAKCRSPHKLYCGITRAAANLVNAEKCSLMLREKETQSLRVSAVTGVDRWLIGNIRVRAGEGIAGRVYVEGVPLLIDCAEGIRKYVVTPRPRYKTPSSIVLPLGMGDETIGVLNLSDKRSGEPFTADDLMILSAFSAQVFFILKISGFYRELEQMRQLSTTDFLTGIFNRRYFNLRLCEEHQRVQRQQGMFSLAMLDIDDFKLLNDREGHLAGDRVLKDIATVMSRIVRANDILARFGGEEFAVIMPQTSETTALRVAERIRSGIRNIRQSKNWSPSGLKITASIGVSSYGDCTEPVENVIERADLALRRAKLLGKDCAVLYSDKSGNAAGEERSSENSSREITGGPGGNSCRPCTKKWLNYRNLHH